MIISCCAPPEPIVAGRINWDIADFMAERGHEVWLITPYPSRPISVDYPRNGKNKTIVTKIKKNFLKVQINSFVYPKYNMFLRICESFSFGVKSIKYINKVHKTFDILYVMPWPFLGQLVILILRKIKDKPIVTNVQDLYPESFFTKMNYNFVYNMLNFFFLLDKYIANKSTHLTVISDSLRQVYIKNRKISESKISTIHNWQDESQFKMISLTHEQIIDKYSLHILNENFVFMYLGNIGPVAGVETIIEAFCQLENPNTVLVIAGAGSQREKCQLLANDLKASNVVFQDVPAGLNSVAELQKLADVLLLPIHPEAANSSIPSKLIAYMAAAKPIFCAFQGTASNIVLQYRCGVSCESSDVSAITKQMKILCEMEKDDLRSMGDNARSVYLKRFTREIQNHKVEEILSEAISRKK